MNCNHCGKPVPENPPGKRGPKPRYCTPACAYAFKEHTRHIRDASRYWQLRAAGASSYVAVANRGKARFHALMAQLQEKQ